MAQRTQIILIDDIDGGDASETVTFGLDGHDYEIDVNDAHAAEVRKVIGEYTIYARRTSKGGKKAKKAATLNGTPVKNGKSVELGPSARLIRDWARSNGVEVPDRGRVPQSVIDAYEAAH